ncbi:MAG: rhodanese-like domain-containing protein [Parasphingorhabdus sp.]|uniref:rhodanese-like domain-containing protein n=1 Tax=Parasphingorhabdus sp. TaxID=2709688 RepID=UPI003297DA8B
MRIDTGYAGDIDAQGAFEALETQQNAVLVDVRTQAEWTFVGIPDLSTIGKDTAFAEWQSFPPSGPNPDFVKDVVGFLEKKGLDPATPIYFLCRSGARSKAAAIALTQAGYTNCFNISDGFEGALDAEGHRGLQSGWKAAKLPWKQN